MTGELQEKAQAKLNISLTGFAVKKPVTSPTENTTLTEINKINKIVVVTQASSCRAQSPCDVQPLLKVLDQNVYLYIIIKRCNIISSKYIIF